MKEMLDKHFEVIFEMGVLMLLFVVGAILLARFPGNKELEHWVTSGVIIGALARAFGTKREVDNTGIPKPADGGAPPKEIA